MLENASRKAWTDFSLSCLVPSLDLRKCAVQIEADLMPFCSSWTASEYLPRCHRGFDRLSGWCQTLGLNSSEGHTFRGTPVMETSARVFAVGILMLKFFVCSFIIITLLLILTSVRPNTWAEVLLDLWKYVHKVMKGGLVTPAHVGQSR